MKCRPFSPAMWLEISAFQPFQVQHRPGQRESGQGLCDRGQLSSSRSGPDGPAWERLWSQGANKKTKIFLISNVSHVSVSVCQLCYKLYGIYGIQLCYMFYVCFSMCYIMLYGIIRNISLSNVSLLQSRFQKIRYYMKSASLNVDIRKRFEAAEVSHMAQKIILNSP